MPIEVVEGKALTITISELPQYTGDGWHWTPNDQLQYPDCPQSVRVDTGV